MAVRHRSNSIPTTTRNRAKLDPCRAVHPPANRVRTANTDRSILRPTRPHAQCGKPITQENMLSASWHDRPPTRVRPRFECKKTKRAIARAMRPPATHQENVFKRHSQTERPSARSTHSTDPTHERARECGQILRTLLFIQNDSASSIKA